MQCIASQFSSTEWNISLLGSHAYVTCINSVAFFVIYLPVQDSSASTLSPNPTGLRRLWSSWSGQWRTRGVDSFCTFFVLMLLDWHRRQCSCCTQCRGSTRCRLCSIFAGLSSPAEFDAITSTIFQRRRHWRSIWSRHSTTPWHDCCTYGYCLCRLKASVTAFSLLSSLHTCYAIHPLSESQLSVGTGVCIV